MTKHWPRGSKPWKQYGIARGTWHAYGYSRMTPEEVTADRYRRTRSKYADLEDELVEVVASRAPLTVRSVYYLMLGDNRRCRQRKDEGDSRKTYILIGKLLKELRWAGRIPFESIVDGSRVIAGDVKWNGNVEEFSQSHAMAYLRPVDKTEDIQAGIEFEPRTVGLITESRGVMQQLGEVKGVDFKIAAAGYISLGTLWALAQRLSGTRYCQLLCVADHDPDGHHIPNSAYENLMRMMDLIDDPPEISMQRLAVNEHHISEYNLPTKVLGKKIAPRMRNLGFDPDLACEAESLDPDTLRDIVREAAADFQSGFSESDERCRRAAEPITRHWRDTFATATAGVDQRCNEIVDEAENNLKKILAAN